MPDDPTMISAADAARLLGVSRQRVSELIQLGRLSGVKVGHNLMVPRSEVVLRLALARSHTPRINVQAVAKKLRVTPWTVRRYYRAGLLPAMKDQNGHLMFKPEDVAMFVKPKPTGRPPKKRGVA